MKTGFVAASTSQASEPTVEPRETIQRGWVQRQDDEERSEVVFEATILRLDGATVEWLFRRAGEV